MASKGLKHGTHKSATPGKDARLTCWILLVLTVATLAVYSPVGHFEFLNYDDPDYANNAHVVKGVNLTDIGWAFRSTEAANWFPLTWVSHMIDRSLFGASSGAQHLVNLGLHVAAALILLLAMKRLTGALWPSAFVASLFSLHPLHIESVAWIAERKDVLSALFFFVTLWAYAWYVERRTTRRYVFLALSFACALMSKPTTVTLPIILLLLDYCPLRRTGFRRLLLEKIPFFLMAGAVSVVAFLVQRHGGAVLALSEIPFGLRVSNALISYAVYILKFFWPVNLAVFYPYETAIPAWEWVSAAFTLIAITIAVLMLRRRYLITGWLWFLIVLAPMIGIVQAGAQARADRYTYIASTGLAIMLAWALSELSERAAWGRRALAGASIAAVIAAAVTTSFDLEPWHDSARLFEHALKATDGNYVAANNLGVALRRSGEVREAAAMFESAVRMRPGYAEAQSNFGEALLIESKADEALPHILEALRLDPKLADAHVNLASTLSRAGQFREAAGEYRTALTLQPGNSEAHAGLGIVLTELAQYREASSELLTAIEIQPSYADAHYNLGRLYGLTGQVDQAISEFNETLRLQPDNPQAQFNLGVALAGRGDLAGALDHFRAAVRLNPTDPNAHFNLASALATTGNYPEAIQEFSEVLRLKPGFTDAERGLQYCVLLRDRRSAGKAPVSTAR